MLKGAIKCCADQPWLPWLRSHRGVALADFIHQGQIAAQSTTQGDGARPPELLGVLAGAQPCNLHQMAAACGSSRNRDVPCSPAPWQEEHTLLSATAVALSHAGCPWPLLLPVHDAVRDGYRGVAVVQPATAAQGWAAAGQTVKFETDSLHSSRLPKGLLQLDQLLLLFAKQLAAAGAPAAAAACRAAVAAEVEPLPASIAAEAAAARAGSAAPQQGGTLCVTVAVRHCYALPSPDEEQGRWKGCFRSC